MQQSQFFVQLVFVLALKQTASEAKQRQFNLLIAKCSFVRVKGKDTSAYE